MLFWWFFTCVQHCALKLWFKPTNAWNAWMNSYGQFDMFVGMIKFCTFNNPHFKLQNLSLVNTNNQSNGQFVYLYNPKD